MLKSINPKNEVLLGEFEPASNKAIEDISEAMEVVKSLSNGGYIEITSPKSDREKPKKGEKKEEPEEEPEPEPAPPPPVKKRVPVEEQNPWWR